MSDLTTACEGHHFLPLKRSTEPSALVSFGKAPKRPEAICLVAQHNLREKWALECHPLSTKPRYRVLAGDDNASTLAESARQRVEAVGAKVKKNTVQAIEIIVSLSPDHGIDEVTFFRAAAIWFARRLGGEDNLLSAVIHYDESCEHVHILIQPLKNGGFCGSDMLSRGRKFKSHQIAFDQEVASKMNVRVLIPVSMSHQQRKLAGAAVLERLRQDEDPACRSAVYQAIQNSILLKPVPFMKALDIDLPNFLHSTTGWDANVLG